MKYILVAIMALLLLGCEKEKNNQITLQYDYKIIRSYTEANLLDSIVYYYNNNHQLIAYDNLYYNEWHRYNIQYKNNQIHVTCASDNILLDDKIYFLGKQGRMDSIHFQNLAGNFVLWYQFNYENNQLKSAIRRNTVPKMQNFYYYEDDIHNIDSISVDTLIPNHYTIIEYFYADTLKPDFMVDECGLYEYPSKSEYLVRSRLKTDYMNGEEDIYFEQYIYMMRDNYLEMKVTTDGTYVSLTRYWLIN